MTKRGLHGMCPGCGDTDDPCLCDLAKQVPRLKARLALLEAALAKVDSFIDEAEGKITEAEKHHRVLELGVAQHLLSRAREALAATGGKLE